MPTGSELNTRKSAVRDVAKTSASGIGTLCHAVLLWSSGLLQVQIIAVNRFLMKLFRSNNIEIIAECRRYFHFNLPSELIEKKKTKFEENYSRCVLVLRDICVRVS